jgi:SAM-dependent methyltransferase
MFVQKSIDRALKSTDIPYFMRSMAAYKRNHCLDNFAGNLLCVKEEYLRSTEPGRRALSDRFHAIIDNLVMQNGVKKTTYSMRQNSILSAVLSEKKCRIEKDHLKVLDVPSSTGTASLNHYEMLNKHYRVSSYVLGDLYFKIYYDAERECIYDEEWNLLQKKFKTQFFTINRAHRSADVHHIVPYGLFLPFNLLSWYLKRRYKRTDGIHTHLITLLHPDVERKLNDGIFSMRKINVFENIGEQFDLIISFNLLQKNYFPRTLVQKGMDNLKDALSENGLLIMGDTVSFSVLMRRKGELVLIKKKGEF